MCRDPAELLAFDVTNDGWPSLLSASRGFPDDLTTRLTNPFSNASRVLIVFWMKRNKKSSTKKTHHVNSMICHPSLVTIDSYPAYNSQGKTSSSTSIAKTALAALTLDVAFTKHDTTTLTRADADFTTRCGANASLTF